MALLGAVFAVVVSVGPPLSSWACRYDVAEAVQFGLLALVVPMLFALGAPFRKLTSGSGAVARWLNKRVMARRTKRTVSAAIPAVVGYLAMLVFWRTPFAVDQVAMMPTFVVVEAVTFLAAGFLFFSEIVSSPPVMPHVSGPRRIALCILPMWTTWLVAYLLAFAHDRWFPALHRGSVISLIADQQLAAGVLWAMSAFVFVPVIFLNLIRFLSDDEEDLEYELAQFVKAERRAHVPGHLFQPTEHRWRR